MNFFTRLKNLWYLGGLKIGADSFKKITLTVPHKTSLPHKKLATIIENNPNQFEDAEAN